MTDILNEIALKHLRVPTFQSRGSDKLDFHDIGCIELGDAMKAAYDAGRASGTVAPVTAVLMALSSILSDAWGNTNEALVALSEGKRNQAIGSIVHLEQTLPATVALLNAALVLNRTDRKGGA